MRNFLRSTTFVLVVSPSKILKYHHTLTYDYGTCGLGVNFYENLVNQIEGHYNDFKQKHCELQSCITSVGLELLFWALLHPRSLTITAHSLMTMEHVDSFGINSTKTCGVYLDIQMISYCLHQNLERRTWELEASKIVSSRNRSDVNRYRLVLMQCQNRLFYKWRQQTTSMDYIWMASRKNMSDSTKRKRLGSKLFLSYECFLLFQEL